MLYTMLIVGGMAFSLLVLLLVGGTGKDAAWWKDTANTLDLEYRKKGANKTLRGRVDGLDVYVDKIRYGGGDGSGPKYVRIGVDSELPISFYSYTPALYEMMFNQLRSKTKTGDDTFDERVVILGDDDDEIIQVVFHGKNRREILQIMDSSPLRFKTEKGRLYGLINQKKVTSENLPQAIRDTVEISKKLDLAYYPYRTRSP